MKKLLFVVILIVAFSLAFPTFSFAQGMMGDTVTVSDGHTAREEAEGNEIWGKLQDGELKCEDLTDENFGALGEYFMGRMAGEQHEAMNKMMIQMMGEEGEEQMHMAMGKRMSDCEPNAPMPQGMMNSGMMNMMMGAWSNPSALSNVNNSMMNFGFTPFGWFGWIFMIIFWIVVVVLFILFVRWMVGQGKNEQKSGKDALEILKERYARSEIDKREFEEKKKTLE